MSFFTALPMAFASLASGYLSHQSTAKANRQNMALAQRQMDFQERMSSTAYQRAIHDMRKAGLSPTLAYQQGGASAPSGASTTVQPELAAGVSSALAASRLKADVDLIKAQTKLTQTQATLQELKVPLEELKALLPSIAASALQSGTSDGKQRFANFLQWIFRNIGGIISKEDKGE